MGNLVSRFFDVWEQGAVGDGKTLDAAVVILGGGNLWPLCCYDKLSCSDHHVVRSGKNGVGGRVGRVRYYNGESTV